MTAAHLVALGRGRFCTRRCGYDQQSRDAQKPETVAARFFAKVNLNGPIPAHRQDLGPCHEWTGLMTDQGYGHTSGFGRKNAKAHRVAFFLAEGRWPDPCALHHCDNRKCVRRSHLFEGTTQDNTADRTAKGRHRTRPLRGDDHWSRRHPERIARGDANGSRKHPEKVPRGALHGARLHPESVLRGEKQGGAKLTDDVVREIRRRREGGELLRVLAADFGVTETLISLVAKRKAWRHI